MSAFAETADDVADMRFLPILRWDALSGGLFLGLFLHLVLSFEAYPGLARLV